MLNDSLDENCKVLTPFDEIKSLKRFDKIYLTYKNKFAETNKNRENNKNSISVEVMKNIVLSFNIKSHKKITIDQYDLDLLNTVDCEWLEKYSWINPNQTEIPFKNIYFLYKLEKGRYVQYKVERIYVTIE